MSAQPQAATAALVAYPPIHEERRPLVETRQAAFYLLREEQTLRVWASQENGPIRPVRVGRRLGWRMDEIRRLVCVEG